MAKQWTEYAVTGQMLKRLSQLQNGHEHNHGTSMAALKFRGLATSWGRECCNITDGGRDCLNKARAAGW